MRSVRGYKVARKRTAKTKRHQSGKVVRQRSNSNHLRGTPIQTSTSAHARAGTAQAGVPSREALVHGVVAAGWRLRHLRTHGVGVNARAHGEA